MILSKYTQPLFDLTALDRNSCKLIGEFAGNDVHLQRGDSYYVLCEGLNTYVKTAFNNHMFGSLLGRNRHLHLFEVLRRTPCSYVAKYKHTIIICHSNKGDVYKFRKIFSHMKGKVKRFFPNRKLDVQNYLREYGGIKFEVIPDEVEIDYKFGNFYLDLSDGMRKYFSIT